MLDVAEKFCYIPEATEIYQSSAILNSNEVAVRSYNEYMQVVPHSSFMRFSSVRGTNPITISPDWRDLEVCLQDPTCQKKSKGPLRRQPSGRTLD